MDNIFISYSRRDEYFARCLAADLQESGAGIWIDVDDIPAGAKWSTAIQEGLRTCDVLILIISPDSMESVNVEDEWQYFLDKNKPIIPVYWRDCEPHFQLRRLQYVDFRKEYTDYDQSMLSLIARLSEHGVHLGTPHDLAASRERFLEEVAQEQLSALGYMKSAHSSRPETQPSRPPSYPDRTLYPDTFPLAPGPRPTRRSTGRSLNCLLVLIGSLVMTLAILGAAFAFGIFVRPEEILEATEEAAAATDTPPPVTPTAAIRAQVALIYSDDWLFLQNISDETLDLGDLRFVQNGSSLEFRASEWGGVQSVHPNGCYQLVRDSSYVDTRPGFCSFNGWIFKGRSSQFWRAFEEGADTFTVYEGVREITTCTIAAGECRFSIQ